MRKVERIAPIPRGMRISQDRTIAAMRKSCQAASNCLQRASVHPFSTAPSVAGFRGRLVTTRSVTTTPSLRNERHRQQQSIELRPRCQAELTKPQRSPLTCASSSSRATHVVATPSYRTSRRGLHTRIARQQEQTQPQHRRESVQPETFYDYFPTALPAGAPPGAPFAVDVRALRREFLKLQATAHPDRQPDEQLKHRAEALSARINEAYRTLADPLLRAQYLLSLRGINVAEDETAKVEDQELLMEVMEAQEDVEAATEEKHLVETKTKNEQRLERCVEALEEAFANDDIEKAKTDCVRLRYLVNVREALKDWEPGKEVRLIH